MTNKLIKIYKLETPKLFRPRTQRFKYPKHNADYGVEQDFEDYLIQNQHLVTLNIKEADFHYLPVYWTRWNLNNDYGNKGRFELQEICNDIIIDDSKTFTICQYDDGPLADLGKSIQFLSSRKGDNGYDIPLLSSHLSMPWFIPKKMYLASFVGRLDTHPVRSQMNSILENRPDILIKNRSSGTRSYVKSILASYISLSPRGYGGSSFRTFESMQLGVAPLLLGDLDTRPFKKYINWDDFSVYTNNPLELPGILEGFDKNTMIEMGKRAKHAFDSAFSYKKWEHYVIKTLMELI